MIEAMKKPVLRMKAEDGMKTVVPPLFTPASRPGASSGTDIPYRLNGRTRRSLLGIAFGCAARGMYSIYPIPLPCTNRQLSVGQKYMYFFPVFAFNDT